MAGYVPIVSASGYASRHPLYLFGVDYSMDPPTEICAACGNLGLFDGDRSAKALWSYLQVFMERGPEGLPKPAPLPPRQSRWQETQQPYRDWYAGLRRRLAKPYGMFKAPLTISLWLGWLLLRRFLDRPAALFGLAVLAVPPLYLAQFSFFAAPNRPALLILGHLCLLATHTVFVRHPGADAPCSSWVSSADSAGGRAR